VQRELRTLGIQNFSQIPCRPAQAPPYLLPFLRQPPTRHNAPAKPALNIKKGAFQLGVGFEFVRFRSSPFYASLSGLHTSFAYSRKDWLGVEGSVVAVFGSSSLFNEPSRLLLYGAGPRIAWDRRTWQAWAHALAGGIHVYPQTASGINGFAIQLGGGVDYPWKPLVSLRIESDYVRSQLYSSGQNSFQLGAGLVFHF
jgi:hypothetical protein